MVKEKQMKGGISKMSKKLAGGILAVFLALNIVSAVDNNSVIDGNQYRTADLNGDTLVNDIDQRILLAYWGEMPHDAILKNPDINADGAVTVLDLLYVIGSFGECDDCDADLDGNGVIDEKDINIAQAFMGIAMLTEEMRNPDLNVDEAVNTEDLLILLASWENSDKNVPEKKITLLEDLKKFKERKFSDATIERRNAPDLAIISDRYQEKIIICHRTSSDGTRKQKEITISRPAVKSHLAHGDYLGKCETERPIRERKTYSRWDFGSSSTEPDASSEYETSIGVAMRDNAYFYSLDEVKNDGLDKDMANYRLSLNTRTVSNSG